MKRTNSIIDNITRIAYGALICIALAIDALGQREKAVVIAVVVATMWACMRIFLEGVQAVHDFMKHAGNDASGLYAVIKKNVGEKNVVYSVSLFDAVPESVYVVFIQGEYDPKNIPTMHDKKPVVVFHIESNK